MRLSCLQENLNKGLGIVGRAVAARTTLPITNNVLLATDQSRLKLVATNLEMAVSCWIGAKVEEEGTITVPARLLGGDDAERGDGARAGHGDCALQETATGQAVALASTCHASASILGFTACHAW